MKNGVCLYRYDAEAEIVRIVRNWRRAIDERGLSEEQRRQFRDDFLSFILDEWMPWHKEVKDLSMLEVNRLYSNTLYFGCTIVSVSYRSVSGIRGLTRECLIALMADIETRNYRQEFNSRPGIPPEHPQSSTTDDIECFFSVLRDVVGKDFTLKQVYTSKHFCTSLITVLSL